MKYFALSLLLLLSVHVIAGQKVGKSFIELKDKIQMTTSLQAKSRAEVGLWKPLLTVLAENEYPKIINDASVKSNRFELLYGIDCARNPNQLKATIVEFLRRCTAFVAAVTKEAEKGKKGGQKSSNSDIIADLFQLPGSTIDFGPLYGKAGKFNDLSEARHDYDGEMWAPPDLIMKDYKKVKEDVAKAPKGLVTKVKNALQAAAVQKVKDVLGLSPNKGYDSYSSRTIKALFDRITTHGEDVKMYEAGALKELEKEFPGSFRWALIYAKDKLLKDRATREEITRVSGFDWENLEWAIDNLETLKKHDPGNADKKGLLAPPHLSWTAQARPPLKTKWDEIDPKDRKGKKWFRTWQKSDVVFTKTAMTGKFLEEAGLEQYTKVEKDHWEFLTGKAFNENKGLFFGSGGNVWRLPFEIRDVTGSDSLRDWMDMINNNRLSTSAGPSGTTDEYFSAMGFFGMDEEDYYACGMRQGALSNMIMGCHHSLAEVAEGAEGPKIVQGEKGPERKARNPILAFNPEEPHDTFRKCDTKGKVKAVKVGNFNFANLQWTKNGGGQAPEPRDHFTHVMESYKAFSGEPKAGNINQGRPLPILYEKYTDFSMIRKDDGTEILRDGHRFRTRNETADYTKAHNAICRKEVSEYFKLLFNCAKKSENADSPDTYRKELGGKYNKLTAYASPSVSQSQSNTKSNPKTKGKSQTTKTSKVLQPKKKINKKLDMRTGGRNSNKGNKKTFNSGRFL